MRLRRGLVRSLLSNPVAMTLKVLMTAGFLAFIAAPSHAQDTAPAGEGGQAETAAEETASEGSSDVLQMLLNVLQDDEARTRLIEQLQGAVGPQAGEGSELPAPVEAIDEALVGPDTMSLGRRIAETTSAIAEDALQSASAVWSQIAAAPNTFSALSGDDVGVLIDTLRDLALVIIATYAIFFVLRWLAKSFFRSMGERAINGGIVQRIVMIVVSAIADMVVVALAWAAGYLIALTFFGDFGQIGIRQTLYLNAFLLVELLKVFLRIVLSPSTGALRMMPIGDAAARKLNSGFTWIISILGYGELLLLPIFNQAVGLAGGQAISALIALISLFIAVGMTLTSRRPVAEWLIGDPEESERGRRFLFLAQHWHWPVLLYLAFLFVVVLVSPAGVMIDVLMASAKILLAIVVGFTVSRWISRAIKRGVTLPDRINERLPLLERRLNAFVPKFLTVIRAIIFLIVLVVILDTINFFDIAAWMQTQFGIRATGAFVSVFFILIFAFGAWLALNSWVDYRLNPEFGKIATTREQTLLSLLRNAATIAILIIALMFALSEIGINIAPLIASAGVLGLAIGFGAQKLVQDIITGVFIQLENAINVGDVITVGGTTGTVERLTIRSVSLRDLAGAYHIIPFSSVDMVTNFVREFGYHVGDVGIAYREDIDEAQEAIVAAFEELRKDPELGTNIIGDMEWFGVQALADSAVILRVRIKCVPGKQWGVGRAFNGVIKKVFDARGIEIPFPHQTLYFGENKDGTAPPAHVTIDHRSNDNQSRSVSEEPKDKEVSGDRPMRENKDAIPASGDEPEEAGGDR